MRVEVYRNLHRKCWSVRLAGGRVQRHTDAVLLRNATFVVQAAGRARVLREGKKNVHAFVRGGDSGTPHSGAEDLEYMVGMLPPPFTLVRVTYNPYRADTFVTTGGQPVRAADIVWLVDGRVYAQGVR